MPDRIILIDKPYRWTSFDVVKKLKKPLLEEKRREYSGDKNEIKRLRVGHAGTLDPLATGLLIVCTGRFTKKISEIQMQQKEYTGTMVLGAVTESYDLETEPGQFKSIEHVDEKLIISTALGFCGNQLQKAPLHSAKKIGGMRAYEKARKGEAFEMKPHEIEVYSFEIVSISLPHINFRICCSKGTYIRSLVHDFGQKLGTGGYLSALCRTRIGDYNLQDATSPEAFLMHLSEIQ